jgi:hypothetical protein
MVPCDSSRARHSSAGSKRKQHRPQDIVMMMIFEMTTRYCEEWFTGAAVHTQDVVLCSEKVSF